MSILVTIFIVFRYHLHLDVMVYHSLLFMLTLHSPGPSHIILPMDEIRGNRLIYGGQRNIYVTSNAAIRRAIYDGGIYLNGNRQYVDMGSGVLCNGRLRNCDRGMTLRYKINPLTLEDNTYFVSSAPLDVYYRGGRMYVVMRTEDKVWQVNTQDLPADDWSQLDVTWDGADTLRLYLNDRLVSSDSSPTRNTQSYDVTRNFYIGRHNTNMLNERYANAVIDDFQIWQDRRDYLITNGFIVPGIV